MNSNERAIFLNLIKVGSEEIKHRYMSKCPDRINGFDQRDMEYPACCVILSAEKELQFQEA